MAIEKTRKATCLGQAPRGLDKAWRVDKEKASQNAKSIRKSLGKDFEKRKSWSNRKNAVE
jgi:hypothetical protein